jgi:hypothetical protein
VSDLDPSEFSRRSTVAAAVIERDPRLGSAALRSLSDADRRATTVVSIDPYDADRDAIRTELSQAPHGS